MRSDLRSIRVAIRPRYGQQKLRSGKVVRMRKRLDTIFIEDEEIAVCSTKMPGSPLVALRHLAQWEVDACRYALDQRDRRYWPQMGMRAWPERKICNRITPEQFDRAMRVLRRMPEDERVERGIILNQYGEPYGQRTTATAGG